MYARCRKDKHRYLLFTTYISINTRSTSSKSLVTTKSRHATLRNRRRSSVRSNCNKRMCRSSNRSSRTDREILQIANYCIICNRRTITLAALPLLQQQLILVRTTTATYTTTTTNANRYSTIASRIMGCSSKVASSSLLLDLRWFYSMTLFSCLPSC